MAKIFVNTELYHDLTFMQKDGFKVYICIIYITYFVQLTSFVSSVFVV